MKRLFIYIILLFSNFEVVPHTIKIVNFGEFIFNDDLYHNVKITITNDCDINPILLDLAQLHKNNINSDLIYIPPIMWANEVGNTAMVIDDGIPILGSRLYRLIENEDSFIINLVYSDTLNINQIMKKIHISEFGDNTADSFIISVLKQYQYPFNEIILNL